MIECEKLGSDGHCHCRLSCQRIEDYQKGREDILKEFLSRDCESCKEHIRDGIYKNAFADGINELLNALPDCDYVGIENLVTLAEQIKEP